MAIHNIQEKLTGLFDEIVALHEEKCSATAQVQTPEMAAHWEGANEAFASVRDVLIRYGFDTMGESYASEVMGRLALLAGRSFYDAARLGEGWPDWDMLRQDNPYHMALRDAAVAEALEAAR